MLEMTLEQQFELTKLEQSIPNLTTQEIFDQLIETMTALMITTNQFSKTAELTLSQEFDLTRMHRAKLSRTNAITLLIDAKRQLLIKRNFLLRFRQEMGLQ